MNKRTTIKPREGRELVQRSTRAELGLQPTGLASLPATGMLDRHHHSSWPVMPGGGALPSPNLKEVFMGALLLLPGGEVQKGFKIGGLAASPFSNTTSSDCSCLLVIRQPLSQLPDPCCSGPFFFYCLPFTFLTPGLGLGLDSVQ